MSNFFRKKNYFFLLLLIISIAAILRFYQLGNNPPSLDWDEASIGYNAYSILKTGRDEYGNFMPLSFRSFDDYKPPVYIYLTVPSVAVFGLNAFAVRFPAVFIGVLAVLAVYFFVKELFVLSLGGMKQSHREWFALLSSFFLAISPWHLQFSRAAFEGNVGMFFLLVSLIFFFKGIKKPLYYTFFTASFVLSIYSYHSFRLINPMLLVLLILLFRKELLKQTKFFGISLLLIVVCAAPVYSDFLYAQTTGARLSMVTIFSDPNVQMMSARKGAIAKENHDIVGQIVYNRRVIFIPSMVKGYFDHFGFDFLFLHGDGGVQHHSYNMGMLYLWDVPFILLGLIFLVKKLNRKIAVLFFVFVLAALPASITTGTPHPVRAIAMIPAFQIISAAGLVGLLIWLYKKNMMLAYSVGVIAALCLFINVAYYLHQYYVETPIKYGYFWQYGNKEAIAYAKKHEYKYQKIIMSYEYDQPYIYYLFHNKIDPAWYQKNWNYSGTGEVQRFYRKIGKYEFENIDYSKDSKEKGTLLIGTPQEIPDTVQPEYIIYFPDGRVAYKIFSI